MTLEEQIEEEVFLYVGYCRLATNRDELEEHYRDLAHRIFYHIQELRSTHKKSSLAIVSVDLDVSQ